LSYDEVEHPVLKGAENVGLIQAMTLYHFGYAREMFRLVRKYVNHLEKSNIHTPEYLREWYLLHLTGKYPVSKVNLDEIPSLIKKYFQIEKIGEELYFQERREAEAKHFIDAWSWMQEFKPETVIEVGCGMGHRVFACHTMGMKAQGFDISEYAIKNTPYKNLLDQGMLHIADITTDFDVRTPFDLVICYDILEHLEYEELEKALENIWRLGKKDFVFSIPFLGDPNLENDPTHKIKETREWWIDKLMNHGLKIKSIPQGFIYKNQLIVASK
jgi:2-polyprenyl-3-methyl-5-hydroxy-6-metoxy-1,4-benzoquinol methylase